MEQKARRQLQMEGTFSSKAILYCQAWLGVDYKGASVQMIDKVDITRKGNIMNGMELHQQEEFKEASD